MKFLKALTCAVTMAVALAFGGASAKAYSIIGQVTNYSTLTIALTLKSTDRTSSLNGAFKDTLHSQLINNKSLLSLFTNEDFADESFPSGARLVIGWDGAWAGHVLVVNQAGTGIIYDTTAGSAGGTNSFSLNLFAGEGAQIGSGKDANPGGYNVTQYNFATLNLTDQSSLSVKIIGAGLCTEKTKVIRNAAGDVTSWTDSEDFAVTGAGATIPGIEDGTITGTIKASAHAKSIPAGFGD